ncbi:MAG: tetratricopeptide repeat protein [Archangium sp.]|nr:tetratricopeptide repeat protein [Archangium sp.]
MGRPAPKLNDRAEKDRAHALALKGKYDDAIRIYRGLLKLKSNDAAVWQSLADVCRKRGLLDEAVKAYRTAAEHLEAQGHVPRARAALVVALQLAPGEPSLVNQLNALRAVAPIPDRMKRHLALVPTPAAPPVEQIEEMGDDDIIDSGEPLLPVVTAARPQRGATREATPVSARSLLEELLDGVPEAKPAPTPVARPGPASRVAPPVEARATPSLPPEIAAIFASPPTAPRAVVTVDELLARRTGSQPKLKRPNNPNAHVPAKIAAIFAKPPAPAPAKRHDTRPPPPVPSLIDDDSQDSGFQRVINHVFSDDDELKTDPFNPPWDERKCETVVARPRRSAAAIRGAAPKVPSYPLR